MDDIRAIDVTRWFFDCCGCGDFVVNCALVFTQKGGEMTDVSKAIYSGDWELYPKDGKVTIQDFEHCKIVLTEAEVLEEYSIEYMYEDQLPDGIPDAVYSAMYACSEVDFVRLFPFVTINGQKRFLIELPEVEE